jgi:hypothetical protein
MIFATALNLLSRDLSKMFKSQDVTVHWGGRYAIYHLFA